MRTEFFFLSLLLLFNFFNFSSFVEIPDETFCDQNREHQRTLSIHFDRLCVKCDLSPGNGLIRLSTCITAVKFLCSVHVHRIVSTISHQISIADVMLDDTAS